MLLALLLACRPQGSAPPDTDTDTVVDDTDPADTEDTEDTDDTEDTEPVDTGFAPDPTCEYIDLDQYWLDCAEGYAPFYRMVPVDGDTTRCPVYWRSELSDWETLEEAVAATGCGDDCIYAAHVAVMVVHCDARGEFIEYRDGAPGQTQPPGTCPSFVYGSTLAGQGWAPDWDTWLAEHPCP